MMSNMLMWMDNFEIKLLKKNKKLSKYFKLTNTYFFLLS